ncbi:MAG: hypothetical protein MJK10_09360 [Pseudomonadales bacterium]|nr:hypothetical protein [Pseudomonadales bacterium]NRA16252.1 hypothetical protein [Oceanospirillaceae bacterium]
MKHVLVIFAILLSGCATNQQKYGINPEVDMYQINSSVSQQTEAAGMVLADKIIFNDYPAAIELLEKLYAATIADISQEQALLLEINHISTMGQVIDDELDAIVSQYPNNHLSYLLRGYYLTGKANRARGGDWDIESSDQQLQQMEKIHQQAIRDLHKVLQLANSNYLAHIALADIYHYRVENAPLSQLHFKQAIELQPASYELWSNYLASSIPRWRGSYAKMQQIITQMKNYSLTNKKLTSLQNFILYDQGSVAAYDGDYRLALEKYSQALHFGTDYKLLLGLGSSNMQLDYPDQGCLQLRQALKLRPYEEPANYWMLICNKLDK